MKSTRKVALSFENIVEFLPTRGSWWSLGFYDNPLVKEELKNQPRTTVSLEHVVNSLIIARGLKVTLEFSDASQSETWEQYRKGGSLSIWGFKLGEGGGGGSSYSYSRSEDKLSVTFEDSENACRVLGFRVTKLPIQGLPRWLEIAVLPDEERISSGLRLPINLGPSRAE